MAEKPPAVRTSGRLASHDNKKTKQEANPHGDHAANKSKYFYFGWYTMIADINPEKISANRPNSDIPGVKPKTKADGTNGKSKP